MQVLNNNFFSMKRYFVESIIHKTGENEYKKNNDLSGAVLLAIDYDENDIINYIILPTVWYEWIPLKIGDEVSVNIIEIESGENKMLNISIKDIIPNENLDDYYEWKCFCKNKLNSEPWLNFDQTIENTISLIIRLQLWSENI